jgi:hypothetical protein
VGKNGDISPLLVPNHALYQLSYAAESTEIIITIRHVVHP